MKIEITSGHVKVREMRNKTTGELMVFRSQKAFFHREGEPYPEHFDISLGKDDQPFSPGFYFIDDQSFFVGRFGDLEIARRLVLRPIAEVRAA